MTSQDPNHMATNKTDDDIDTLTKLHVIQLTIENQQKKTSNDDIKIEIEYKVNKWKVNDYLGSLSNDYLNNVDNCQYTETSKRTVTDSLQVTKRTGQESWQRLKHIY